MLPSRSTRTADPTRAHSVGTPSSVWAGKRTFALSFRSSRRRVRQRAPRPPAAPGISDLARVRSTLVTVLLPFHDSGTLNPPRSPSASKRLTSFVLVLLLCMTHCCCFPPRDLPRLSSLPESAPRTRPASALTGRMGIEPSLGSQPRDVYVVDRSAPICLRMRRAFSCASMYLVAVSRATARGDCSSVPLLCVGSLGLLY